MTRHLGSHSPSQSVEPTPHAYATSSQSPAFAHNTKYKVHLAQHNGIEHPIATGSFGSQAAPRQRQKSAKRGNQTLKNKYENNLPWLLTFTGQGACGRLSCHV